MHKQNKMLLQERKKKGLLKSLNVADSQKQKSKQKMALRLGSFRYGGIPAKSVDENPVVVNGHYSQLFLCLITPTGQGSLPPALVAPLSAY